MPFLTPFMALYKDFEETLLVLTPAHTLALAFS
jgi:hypothetical protein